MWAIVLSRFSARLALALFFYIIKINERLPRLSYNSSMCGGIEYQDHKLYFPQPDARLPIRLRHGGVTWKAWGRRKEETIGIFPNGGWARLDSIKNGKWKPWHPRPVLIPVDSFMEKDHQEQIPLVSIGYQFDDPGSSG